MPRIKIATAYAYINDELVSSIVNNDYTKISHSQTEFIPNVAANKLCFNGTV